jgi:hypothetical protein
MGAIKIYIDHVRTGKQSETGAAEYDVNIEVKPGQHRFIEDGLNWDDALNRAKLIRIQLTDCGETAIIVVSGIDPVAEELDSACETTPEYVFRPHETAKRLADELAECRAEIVRLKSEMAREIGDAAEIYRRLNSAVGEIFQINLNAPSAAE